MSRTGVEYVSSPISEDSSTKMDLEVSESIDPLRSFGDMSMGKHNERLPG